MAKKKGSPARFKVGDRVYVAMLERNCEITDVFWSGLTWMYSFVGEELTCGEMYLRPASE